MASELVAVAEMVAFCFKFRDTFLIETNTMFRFLNIIDDQSNVAF